MTEEPLTLSSLYTSSLITMSCLSFLSDTVAGHGEKRKDRGVPAVNGP